MAARLLPLQSILHLFQPLPALRQQQPLLSHPVLRRILNPSIPASLPLAAFAGASDILREIWDGLLRAVPKKKTSHMKKRHRQMAGKALKDVTHMTKCSACGRPKRAHVLCPYCVEAVRTFFTTHAGKQFRVRQAQPKSAGRQTTYNPAQTAPGLWESIKKGISDRKQKQKEDDEDDKTRW